MRHQSKLALLAAATFLTQPALAADLPQGVPVAQLVKRVSIPYSTFTLDNGLRVIVHEDRKAPVVAVWSGTMSARRTSRPGETGFAHLFEHLMFNGSENAPGDYFAPLQRDRRDRPQRHHLVRPHQLFRDRAARRARARAVPRKRPHGPPARRASPRRSSTTSAASSRTRSARATTSPTAWSNMPSSSLFPAGHPYHHSTIGSMADLDAATLDDVQGLVPQQLRPEQRRAGPRRRHRRRRGAAAGRAAISATSRAGRSTRRPRRPSRRCRAASTRVMHDRVANTRLYRTWVVPGPHRRGHGAAGGRRRRARRPRQLAARQCAGARRAELRSASRASVQPLPARQPVRDQVDVKPGQASIRRCRAALDAADRRLRRATARPPTRSAARR